MTRDTAGEDSKKMRLRPFRDGVVIWVGLGLILLAWGGPAAAGEKVRLALPGTGLSMMPVYLAQALGFFDAEGLVVERIATQSGGPEIKALIAGQVDFSFTSGENVLVAHQQRQRLLVVFSGLHRLTINWAMQTTVAKERGVTTDSPVDHKLWALKGLKIGVAHLGSLGQRLAEYTVRRAGLSPEQDVRFVHLGNDSDWLAGLEGRRVEVVLTPVPFPEMAAAAGKAIVLINNAKGEDASLSEFLMANLIVRPEYLKKHSDRVRRMVRALYRANRWALTNPAEQVAEVLQPFLPRMEPKTLLDGVKATLPALTPDGRTTERALEVTSTVLETVGLLKKKAPYAEIVTNEYVPRQETCQPSAIRPQLRPGRVD